MAKAKQRKQKTLIVRVYESEYISLEEMIKELEESWERKATFADALRKLFSTKK